MDRILEFNSPEEKSRFQWKIFIAAPVRDHTPLARNSLTRLGFFVGLLSAFEAALESSNELLRKVAF